MVNQLDVQHYLMVKIMINDEFKDGDFIVLNVNSKESIHLVSKEAYSDENFPTVSEYFANTACKREIISKWFPRKNEICYFIFDDKKYIGILDNYSPDDYEGLPYRYLDLTDYNYSYAHKVQPYYGNIIDDLLEDE